jgi:Tol biopolymer transport system component
VTSVICKRLLAATLLMGLVASACDNTSLVGAEPPKTNVSASGGAAGSAPAPNPVEIFAGDTEVNGTPMRGPWLFFDSLHDLNRDIYAARADGTAFKRMTTSPASEREPAVSPDGKTLAFSADVDETYQIYLMPLPAGAVHQLTHRKRGAQQPSWSSDGTQLVFSSADGLFVIGSDGQNEQFLLKESVIIGDVLMNRDAHAVFVPNRRAILFDRGAGIHQYDLDAHTLTAIVSDSTTTIEHPSVSPDQHSIAFDIWCPGDTFVSVWIVPLLAETHPCIGGARVTFASDGPAGFPSFSPDGLIAFEHGPGPTRIGIVNPSGSIVDVTLGEEDDDRNPSWSPVDLVLP